MMNDRRRKKSHDVLYQFQLGTSRVPSTVPVDATFRLRLGHGSTVILRHIGLHLQNTLVGEQVVLGWKLGQDIMAFCPPPVFFHSSFSCFPQKNTWRVRIKGTCPEIFGNRIFCQNCHSPKSQPIYHPR